jgi:hypothetical protein
MTVKKKATKKSIPLIIEAHPKEYEGYPFVTVIEYRKLAMLAIVDNADDSTVKAFVLDYCGAENVNEEKLIVAAADWYIENRTLFPVSVEFSRRGMTVDTSKIYRSLNVEFISRIIGPVPKFPMNTVKSIKRRRRKAIPAGVEIRYSTAVLPFEQLAK